MASGIIVYKHPVCYASIGLAYISTLEYVGLVDRHAQVVKLPSNHTKAV